MSPLDEPQHQFAGARMPHVHCDAHLVGVVAGKVAAAINAGYAIAEGRGRAESAGTLSRLNPDYGRSIFAEILGGHGSNGHPAEIEDVDPVQGF